MSAQEQDGATKVPGKRRNTVEDVRRMGAEIIATKGYEQTSIQNIADALGITKATIYHHVKSKEQLLFDIISDYQIQGRKMIEVARMAGPDPVNSLKSFIRELVAMNSSNAVMGTLLTRELHFLQNGYLETVLAARDEYERFVHDLILNAQAIGKIRNDIDSHLASMSVFLLPNSMLQWYRTDGKLTPEEIATNFERLLLNGLLTGQDANVKGTTGRSESKPSSAPQTEVLLSNDS